MFLNKDRLQRVIVGVIVGAVVLALALTLVGTASASALSATTPSRAVVQSSPTPSPEPFVGSDGQVRPTGRTPQGDPTTVGDREHLGGLIAFIAFMGGGVLLLLRNRQRERRERKQGAILSQH